MILDRRLVAADLLKLLRRPRMTGANATLAVGFIAFMLFAQRGIGFTDLVGFVAIVCVVVGVNVGSMAGAQDREAGLLRDLFATGRSRTALYASRVAGATLVGLLLVVPTVLFSLVASQLAWDASSSPGAQQVAAGATAALAGTLLGVSGGVGLAGFLGSRSTVIAILTTWYLAVSQLLENLDPLGDATSLLPSMALKRFADHPGFRDEMSYVTSIGVLLLWAVVPLAIGAWRENRREI
jgi:hypothetical protein